MSATPRIPQKTVNIDTGERVTGSEVIDCRVTTPDRASTGIAVAPGSVELAPDGVWEVIVPERATWPLDLAKNTDFAEDGWRGAGAALVRRLNTLIAGHPVRAKKHLVQIAVPDNVSARALRSFAIGLSVGGHSYVTTNAPRPATVANVRIVLPTAGTTRIGKNGEDKGPVDLPGLAAAVDHGALLGRTTCLSRDLANTPSNIKTPAWLAKQARKLAGGIDGVKVKLRDAEWLEDKGFGGILAVGRGSVNQPMLIEMVWDPQRVGIEPRRQPVVLVGKGVTFDTGGISIKPAENMGSMITDMTGGAGVISAFRTLAELQVPRKIVALIPTAENMVDGASYRPGDVVEHYGGITTEVQNTDAEGRMLLADAISYGAKKYQPAVIVSMATLTGAAKIALGMRTGAVFADNWGVGVKLSRRGSQVGERWWPMPLPSYLEEAVDSRVADVLQTPKGRPWAITAAMFLRRFSRDVPLIHLDIAGPGRAEATYNEVTPLGTGFGARTLVQWLMK